MWNSIVDIATIPIRLRHGVSYQSKVSYSTSQLYQFQEDDGMATFFSDLYFCCQELLHKSRTITDIIFDG